MLTQISSAGLVHRKQWHSSSKLEKSGIWKQRTVLSTLWTVLSQKWIFQLNQPKSRAKTSLDTRFAWCTVLQHVDNQERGKKAKRQSISADYLTWPHCTDISGEVQAKLSSAFSCSCTRELEEIYFRVRVQSSLLQATIPQHLLRKQSSFILKVVSSSCHHW